MIPIAKAFMSEDEISELCRVIRTGFWASGIEVAEFETEFAAYCDVSHAIAVSNGTVAIQVVMQSLGIPRGSHIVTTPFTFIATSACISHCGAIPVFVDIDPATFLVDLNQVEDAVKKFRPAAVLVVHLFGQACDGLQLRQICDRFGTHLIEDCAQAQGTHFQGRHVGTFGIAGTHSFYATKNLPVGEGGMVVTNSPKINETVRRLINHGRLAGYEHVELGFNYRMTNVSAAIGRCQLRRLDANNLRRQLTAERYKQEINNTDLVHPTTNQGSNHIYHQYTVRTPRRTSLKAHLDLHQIGNAIVYPKLSYQQIAFEKTPFENQGCKHAERAVEEVISIPVHPYLSDAEVNCVIETINAWQ